MVEGWMTSTGRDAFKCNVVILSIRVMPSRQGCRNIQSFAAMPLVYFPQNRAIILPSGLVWNSWVPAPVAIRFELPCRSSNALLDLLVLAGVNPSFSLPKRAMQLARPSYQVPCRIFTLAGWVTPHELDSYIREHQ